MINFRQIQTFVCVYEEGSFSRAARRFNATQSGLSTQLRELEERLGLQLFERSSKGVVATPAGERLYRHATQILRDLSAVESEMASLAEAPGGRIRVGLMPAFTHSILAPALIEFIDRYPGVEVSIAEAFSPTLAEDVTRGDYDFAVIPVEPARSGVRAQYFGTDWELLVSGPESRLEHLAPVTLAELDPLKLILPTRGNARRHRLEAYFTANSVPVAEILEMDAMTATLNLVAETDWMTILPATICARDMKGKRRKLHPITAPEATVDYMLIEPRRRALSASAVAFKATIEAAFCNLHEQWNTVLGGETR